MTERKTMLFCARRGDVFRHFYPHPGIVRLCFGGTVETLCVTVEEEGEGKESSYWAWWNNEDQKFQFVYRRAFLVRMCFPNDIDLYVKRGDGLLLPVSVTIKEGDDDK